MTKEQLQLHGSVIKWYIDNLNKGIWKKEHKTKNWYLLRNPQFNIKDTYVQNDEFAKYRMALEDGKTIQFRTASEEIIWIDCNPDWTLSPIDYRIKPEFKEGDWVRIKNSVEVAQIKTVKYHSVVLKGYDEDTYRFFNGDITIWEPKVNELCIFWTRENNGYSIKKFNFMAEDGTFITLDKARYTYAAPLEFIETLKENKMTREKAKIPFLNTYQDDNFIEKEFPQIRDKYWFVLPDGDCCFDEWEDNGIHLDRLFLGNVFRTEKEAKQHAKELRAKGTYSGTEK